MYPKRSFITNEPLSSIEIYPQFVTESIHEGTRDDEATWEAVIDKRKEEPLIRVLSLTPSLPSLSPAGNISCRI